MNLAEQEGAVDVQRVRIHTRGLHISEDYGIQLSLSPQNAVFGALSL